MVKYQTVEEKPKEVSISQKKESKSNSKMLNLAVSRIREKQFTKRELDYILKCVNNYLSNYKINVTRKPDGEAARMYHYIEKLKIKVESKLKK